MAFINWKEFPTLPKWCWITLAIGIASLLLCFGIAVIYWGPDMLIAIGNLFRETGEAAK